VCFIIDAFSRMIVGWRVAGHMRTPMVLDATCDGPLESWPRHFPPGTSKWNKVEHCLFSFIARNWRGESPISRQTVVSLIGATTSTKGLKVYAELDENSYQRGIKITDGQLATVNLKSDPFHGEWNYTISPQLDS
jgi:hypothetical protein